MMGIGDWGLGPIKNIKINTLLYKILDLFSIIMKR